MLPRLQIELLGTCRLVYDGEPLTRLATPRLHALLAYLALRRGTPQLRRHLAAAFWPSSSRQQARTNLRKLLHRLRHALPEPDAFVLAEAQSLTWRHDAPCTLDVAAFEAALAEAIEAAQRADEPARRNALERAAALYRGDLLPSCYDAWIEPERDRLRQRALEACEQLVHLLEQQRAYAAARRYARRLLQHDPLREDTYRHLMRLHALQSDRAGALRVYDECTALLQRELGIAPEAETQHLYQRLRRAEPVTQPQPDTAPPQQTGPLVGRHTAWRALTAAWREAAAGGAQLALITGQAGIGKTRLMDELLDWAAQQGLATARARSFAAEGRLAYAPVAAWLRADTLRPARRHLDPAWLTELMRVLPELHSEHPTLPHPEPPGELWQRQRLFEALARAVLAGGAPLLLALDDMQWTDHETLAWLRFLLRFAPEARLLVVGTVRSEDITEDHPVHRLWLDLRRDGQATEIVIEALSAEETAAVAAHVAGRALEPEEAARFYAETEGNPLFIIESVRAGQLGAASPGAAPGEATALPPKVHAVLAARLAQLSPPARALAGIAATIGRTFSFDTLLRATDLDETSIAESLDELWQRQIIREQGTNAYDFSHDKLREVAYASLSSARRRLLHGCVARALEAAPDGDGDALSGQLAAHYEQAGHIDAALHAYRRAAAAAQKVFADAKAIGLYRKALALLATVPATPARAEQELAIQTALGALLVASGGYAAPDVLHAYERARALCEQLGRPTAAPVLRGLALARLVTGAPRQACVLGEELLHRAEHETQPLLLVEGQYVLGSACFWQGAFQAAQRHFEEALAHYRPENHALHVALYAQDPKVICRCRLARTLWHLGYADQAVEQMEQALALARALRHPYTIAYALDHAGHFYIDMRRPRRAAAVVEELLVLAERHRFAECRHLGTVLQGWLLAAEHQDSLGPIHLRHTAFDYARFGRALALTHFLGYLAAAYLRAGALEEGLATIDDALERATQYDEHFFEAELYRLQGELRLRSEDPDAAERCFREAFDLACHQQARIFALRAAMSLAWLLRQRGDIATARHHLALAYDAFTEGFDTPDLRDARALLDALSDEAPAEVKPLA